jgi:hypothetical protein
VKNTWLFPAIESVHLIGMALVVGTIALLDLRALGWIPASAMPAETWTRRGLIAMVLTGLAMFFADTVRYVHNAAFWLKMAVLAVALVFHFTIHRRGSKWAAVLSLTLWTSLVVCGRLIADFDI